MFDTLALTRRVELVTQSLNEYLEQPDAIMTLEEAAPLIREFQRRPLLRICVMRMIEKEMAAAGVDWDAIGDFLVKIAPLIFEFLKMFM